MPAFCLLLSGPGKGRYPMLACLLGGGVCSIGSIGLSFILVGHSIHVKNSLWERHDVSPVRIVEDLLLRLLCTAGLLSSSSTGSVLTQASDPRNMLTSQYHLLVKPFNICDGWNKNLSLPAAAAPLET